MAARATAARCATPKAPRAASYTTTRDTTSSWLKPRRRQPLVHMRCGIKLPDLVAELVHFRTRLELCQLRLEFRFLGSDISLKGMRNGSATMFNETFHDAASCLRVLTVGFAES